MAKTSKDILGLFETLKNQMHDQVNLNPHGGRALVDRLIKLSKSHLESITDEEYSKVSEGPVLDYLNSIVSPYTLDGGLVGKINKLTGHSNVTKYSTDIHLSLIHI